MSEHLGQGQSTTQAIVVPQEKLDSAKAPMKVSLFKPDGTPFLADTAAVFSVGTLVWNPLAAEAFTAAFDTPNENPWPYKAAIFNQTDSAKNGIYQNQFGAPGLPEGVPQLMIKIAELPKMEAVFVAPTLIASPDRDKTSVLDLEDLSLEEGGVVISAVAGWHPEGGNSTDYAWSIVIDGARVESRLAALES